MVTSAVVQLVEFCTRHCRSIIAGGLLLMIVSAAYDIARFSINTDVETLISRNLPWRQRQFEFSKVFPQKGILVVVSAATSENATLAANALAQQLSIRSDLFHSVVQPDSGEYFERNGLLFAPIARVKEAIAGLTKAQPLISELAADPTLRSSVRALSFALNGVQSGDLTLKQLVWPLSLADRTLSDVLAGRPGSFSWQELALGHEFKAGELRRFIEISPIQDFGAVQPGAKATSGIQQAVTDLALQAKYNAKVDLTGPVPLADDQFAVVKQSAFRDTMIALVGIFIILWLALRSWKIIASVFFGLAVGLAVTPALGLIMVGAFNLISIAFFVLFVGLGVDFGIQFSVMYRAERHENDDLHAALLGAARKVARRLALAAAATAAGFFSFIPTIYRGISELGLIAGCGMIVAFLCSITFVPAMLALLNPPGELASIGFKQLAPLDEFLQRHRMAVIAGTIGVVLAGTPLLARLQFDFNPIDLENPMAPSVMAYRELQNTPDTSGNYADLLAPSLAQADGVAERSAAIAEVSRALTLNNFVPTDQSEKLSIIAAGSKALNAAFHPEYPLPPPSDQETVDAIQTTVAFVLKVVGNANGQGADLARHVCELLTRLATADVATRTRAEAAFAAPLRNDLNLLQAMLGPREITVKNLPGGLVRDWLSPDGRARVKLVPRGDLNDPNVLRNFATAVLAAYPSATGPAIAYFESGKAIASAFVRALLLALASITVLLIVTLRRITDVLLTLVPLLLALAVALEICVLIGLAMNFANIIALPLMLGVGVAFKIYYIMAWRDGQTKLLQSPLTRAIVFSAMTSAIAFGTMSASSYPGLSSMGKLMALTLFCTMAAAVLFQPVLMGQPRHPATDEQMPDQFGGVTSP